MRELNRMERQFSRDEGVTGGQGQWPLTSLLDRSVITPQIVDQNGQKQAQFQFDVKGFKPEDVQCEYLLSFFPVYFWILRSNFTGLVNCVAWLLIDFRFSF